MSRRNGEEEARERERDFRAHQAALGQPDMDDQAPETLKYVSEPEEVESPADALAWINSKSATTTKLSTDDIRSEEWVLEYFQLLARMDHPPHYGVTGNRRGWARGDYEAAKPPIEPQDKLDFEGFSELGKLAVQKSEGGWGVETTTRNTTESVLRRDEERVSGSGILDKIPGF